MLKLSKLTKNTSWLIILYLSLKQYIVNQHQERRLHVRVCVYACYPCWNVLGEELHGDPHASVHEALNQPGVNIQVSDETNQPDDHEGCSQHHLLPELLWQGQGKETDGYRWQIRGDREKNEKVGHFWRREKTGKRSGERQVEVRQEMKQDRKGKNGNYKLDFCKKEGVSLIIFRSYKGF